MGETIAQNRRARHDYSIEDTLEAARAARHRDQERPGPSREPGRRLCPDRPGRGVDHRLHIAPWSPPTCASTTSRSGARLLLHRHEIDELLGKTKAKGLTLVPLEIYITDHGKAKARLGLARGKQNWDRRREIADRDAKRDMARQVADARKGQPIGPVDRRPRPRDGGGDAARKDAPGGRRARGGRAGRVIGRRARRPGRDDARQGAPPEHHGDALRKLMLNEPRGYPALCANVILPPTNPEAQAGYVIMEHVEYPACPARTRSAWSRRCSRPGCCR